LLPLRSSNRRQAAVQEVHFRLIPTTNCALEMFEIASRDKILKRRLDRTKNKGG
jgi:hypothetical protein